METFLTAFDDVPDPRASSTRHDLCELLVVGFVAVLCGATSCAEMPAFGRSKEHVFKGFLNLKHSIPSHDTFSTMVRMIDPKALDAAFGQVLAKITALLGVAAQQPGCPCRHSHPPQCQTMEAPVGRRTTSGAEARNEIPRATKCLGRAIWRRWSGYHRRSLVETKMRCVKLLGGGIMAREFIRQVAELQVRAAVLNGFTALGIPQNPPRWMNPSRERGSMPSGRVVQQSPGQVYFLFAPNCAVRKSRKLLSFGVIARVGE